MLQVAWFLTSPSLISPPPPSPCAGAARDLEAFKKSPSQRITVHSADLVNAAAMEAAFASIAAAHGGAIDVLVNSAGTECARRFEDTTAEDFEWILKVNVVGTRNAVAGALKYLPGGPSRSSSAASGQGRIVLISSQAGQTGVYGYTAYSASKFALNGFAQSLQMEVATRGIVVSLVFPPDTDTPMLARENQEKPRITRMLTESTSTVKPEVVASGIMSGIASGAPIIPVGFDGWMLSTLNAGMGPSGTLGNALIQVFSMGLWRLIGLAYLQYFYWVVKRNDGAGGASSSEGAGARGRTSATGSARSRSKGGSASLAAPLVSQDHKDK